MFSENILNADCFCSRKNVAVHVHVKIKAANPVIMSSSTFSDFLMEEIPQN